MDHVTWYITSVESLVLRNWENSAPDTIGNITRLFYGHIMPCIHDTDGI